MKQEFKIDFKNQYNSFKQCFFILLAVFFGIVIAGLSNQNFNLSTTLITLLIFYILFLGMVLPFNIQYLIKNWKTRLIVDFNSKTIKITEGIKTSEFKISEISTERIIVNQSAYKTPFKNYGFVRIKTRQNEIFIITSLMANPLKFPLKIDETKYWFPFIKKEITKSELQDLILEKKESEERRVKIFIKSFENLSTEELNHKIENKKKLQSEGIIAVERLLKERT
jgi:hypothetical protein